MSSTTKNELAIEGGECEVNSIFPAWPNYEEDEVQVVNNVLQSGRVNYWTGNIGKTFEEKFAEYFGVKYAIALSNGSVAIELALEALGIGVGDEVVVTSRTFVASASSICIKGAKPIFADVNRNSQNITADTIRSSLTEKSRAIVVVHLAGWPCDMDAILKLAQDHNLKVIEDCAQAHGAKYNDQYVGSFGDVGTFSFCQDKIMTTGGEGGMLITNNYEIWNSAWSYKDHGKSYETMLNIDRSNRTKFQWVHDSIGTNFRMTEMQAAIGLIQLSKLKVWIEKRNQFANIFNSFFSKIDAFRVTIPSSEILHAYYKYYVFVRPEFLKKGWSRDKIVQAINAEGVPCFVGSCSEVYKEKSFINLGLAPEKDLDIAKELGETSLMFNVHPTQEVSDIEKMCCAIDKVLEYALK